METEGHPLAEEIVRLLAGAASAARLYPASSDLPAQAVSKFMARAGEVTGSVGTLRYVLDPHNFRVDDAVIAKGQNQVTAFAEALHAMQVGQLMIAPGITEQETVAFMTIANTEPAEVRSRGIRSMLIAAGVSHIAVIEVTLRQSEEEGLLGIDLASAPLDEIGREVLGGAEKWSETAGAGQGQDDMRAAIDRLEEATREIAGKRIAEALMRLDENSRMRVLALSMRADSSGQRMDGMFEVIARMNPSALARLLMFVAAGAGTEPGRLAAAMDLPPDVAKQVMMLLAPSPRTEAECGVPEDPDTSHMAAEVAVAEDTSDLERQVALAAPALASGKALTTTVSISRLNPTEESVAAIKDALPQAARDGAFRMVREALRRLDEMAVDPSLVVAIEQARGSLQDPEILTDVCNAPITDADAAIAGEILMAAGAAGAEALLGCFLDADEAHRSLFGPVMRGMGEQILQVASRKVRTDDTQVVRGIIKILPLIGDKRAIPVMAQALENLDAEVRRAAVTALAETPGPEARLALAKAVGHWDPETRRHVIREIGRVKAVEALPALIRVLEDINFLERNHELRKEVIKGLESLGSPDALPVLRKWAGRRFVIGQKNKELRFLARRAVQHLSDAEKR